MNNRPFRQGKELNLQKSRIWKRIVFLRQKVVLNKTSHHFCNLRRNPEWISFADDMREGVDFPFS